jgi:hypothetical protein
LGYNAWKRHKEIPCRAAILRKEKMSFSTMENGKVKQVLSGSWCGAWVWEDGGRGCRREMWWKYVHMYGNEKKRLIETILRRGDKGE